MTTYYTARGAGHTHRTPSELLDCGGCALGAEYEVDLDQRCCVAVEGGEARDLNTVELEELRILLMGGGGHAA